MKTNTKGWLIAALLTLVLILAVACDDTGDTDPGDGDTDGDNSPDGDGNDPDGDSSSDGLSIQDIQNDTSSKHPVPGTVVELKGVIATSEKVMVSESSNTRGFFIAAPGGGEYGGLFCIMKGDVDFDPIVGDKIDIKGEYDEFCGVGDVPDEYCSSQVVLSEAPVVTGTGVAPEPVVIDDPSKIATGGELMYVWEHSLVKINDVTVLDEDAGYNMFTVTGDLLVDDMIYSPPVVKDQHFESITAFLYASFNDSKLVGRGPEDFDTGSTTTGLTLADIQNPAAENHPNQGPVSLEGLVVASGTFSVSGPLTGIFVSDKNGGAWSGGLLVWKPTADDANGYDPPALAVGAVIDVEGTYTEYCGYQEPYYTSCSTQIELNKAYGKITDTGETASAPAAQTVNPGDVATGGSQAEQWQFSLVQVENATVTNGDAGYGTFIVTGDLLVDDELYSYDLPATGTDVTRLTGFLYTSYNEFKLLPRSADDVDFGDGPDGDVDGDADGDADGDVDYPTSSVVINEVLYNYRSTDQTITDDPPYVFIEIYGPGNTSLSGYTLVGLNGSNNQEYGEISLSGHSIPADGFFVIAHTTAEASLAAVADLQSDNADYQNGPDAILLKKDGNVVDTLGYAFGTDVAPAAEGTSVGTVNGPYSTARKPDGADTNDNATDFMFCATPSPGASNSGCTAPDWD